MNSLFKLLFWEPLQFETLILGRDYLKKQNSEFANYLRSVYSTLILPYAFAVRKLERGVDAAQLTVVQGLKDEIKDEENRIIDKIFTTYDPTIDGIPTAPPPTPLLSHLSHF